MKNNKKIIGSVAIAVAVIIFSIVGYINSKNRSSNYDDIFIEDSQGKNNSEGSNSITNNSVENKSYTQAASEIKVEIKGEIKKPGVYTMEQDSRLQDLIYKAGGFKKDADRDNVPSLAKKLRDEDCIVIYNKKEKKNKNTIAVSSDNSDGSRESGTEQTVIDINTADLGKLQEIPGVGPVTAQNIIDYREKSGGFKSIEDIKNVDRIGDKTFEKMKDSITVQ